MSALALSGICLCLASGCGAHAPHGTPSEDAALVAQEPGSGVMTMAEVQARLAEACREGVAAEYEKCVTENAEIRADPGFGETVFERTMFALFQYLPLDEFEGVGRQELVAAWGAPMYSQDGSGGEDGDVPMDSWALSGVMPDLDMVGTYYPTWTYVDVEYDGGGQVASAKLHAEYYLC